MLETIVGTLILFAFLCACVGALAAQREPAEGRVIPGWRRGALVVALLFSATSCATARPAPRLDLVVEHLCGVTATPQGPNWTSVFSYLGLYPTVAPADKDAIVVEALRQCRDRAARAAAKPSPAPSATPTPAPTPSPGG